MKIKMLLLFILTACTKITDMPDEVNNCFDCTIKQSKLNAYRATYCCTEEELQLIIEQEEIKGTTIKCKKL